jgi:GTP-binding protein EngB required for normal cell division
MSDSPTFPDAVTSAGRPLDERLDALDAALTELDIFDDRATRELVAAARERLAAVRSRVALGLDHTVVALVGGTGSGKSALFNAISGLQFAEVGVHRPTTSEVAACVWGDQDATGPLDRLGVVPSRRVLRDDHHDTGADKDLAGLVLLDVPDHDSIQRAHQEIADAMVDAADMLIWVVDPQKYADHMLHDQYLRHLLGHDAALRLVLNQIDRVPDSAREVLLADVERLLIADGLQGVPVYATSTVTGEGIDVLREVLADALHQELAIVRAEAETAAIAATVARGAVAGGPAGLVSPVSHTLPVDEVVAELAAAAGIPAVADGVAAVVRSPNLVPGGPNVPGRPVLNASAVQTQGVAVARNTWLDHVTGPLPPVWRDEVTSRIAQTGALRNRLDDELVSLAVRPQPSAAARVLHGIGVVLGVTALALLAITVLAMLGVRNPVFVRWQDAGLTGFVLGAISVVTFIADKSLRTTSARQQSEAVLKSACNVLTKVVSDDLLVPSQSVLAEHDKLRDLLAIAYDEADGTDHSATSA